MLDSEMIKMLVEGTRDTLYMTLFATFFGYLFGLPMGILLMVTDKEGIRPHSKGAQRVYDIIYKILDVVAEVDVFGENATNDKLWLPILVHKTKRQEVSVMLVRVAALIIAGYLCHNKSPYFRCYCLW